MWRTCFQLGWVDMIEAREPRDRTRKLQGPWGKSLTAPEAILFAPRQNQQAHSLFCGNPLTLESASFSDMNSSEVFLLSIGEMGLTG